MAKDKGQFGRPSKFDERTRKRLLDALSLGSSRKTSAEFAGISKSTFHRWLSDPRPNYVRFREDVEQAEATAVVFVVANLVQLSRRSTRAAIAWLRANGGPEWRPVCRECQKKLDKREHTQ